jgi:hypothetical protein
MVIRPEVESFVFIRIYVLILRTGERFVKSFGADLRQVVVSIMKVIQILEIRGYQRRYYMFCTNP